MVLNGAGSSKGGENILKRGSDFISFSNNHSGCYAVNRLWVEMGARAKARIQIRGPFNHQDER